MLLHIVAGAVDHQPGIGKVRFPEALYQLGKSVEGTDGPGVQADPGRFLSGKAGAFVRHGNIRVAFQHNVGLPPGVQAAVHSLRQEHIVRAAVNDPVGQIPVEPVVAQHIGKVGNDAP